MGVESWAAFALALLVALAVPGPDLVLVVQSATRGARQGASSAAGVVTGLLLHAVLAVAGATALLMSVPGGLTVVQALGAGVLVCMGVSMLCAARRSSATSATERHLRLSRTGYVRGFVTNATNPKALLFFAAILPQFIGNDDGTEIRTVALCATVVIAATLWWTVTISLVRLFGFHRSPTADRVVTIVGGTSLVLIGAVLCATVVQGLVSLAT